MDGLNISPLVDVTHAMQKVTREDAKKEFLKIFCYKVADQMFSDDLLPVSDNKSSYFKTSIDTNLAKKIFAEKIAEQIEKRGSLK